MGRTRPTSMFWYHGISRDDENFTAIKYRITCSGQAQYALFGVNVKGIYHVIVVGSMMYETTCLADS